MSNYNETILMVFRVQIQNAHHVAAQHEERGEAQSHLASAISTVNMIVAMQNSIW